MNGNDTASRSLDISHLDDVGLYRETTKKLFVLVRMAGKYVKRRSKSALFD